MKTRLVITNRKTYLDAIVKVYGNQPLDYLMTLRDGLNILISQKIDNFGYINRLKDDTYFMEKKNIVYHKRIMIL